MTREELVELVDRMLSIWNSDPTKESRKNLYKAWWSIIHDLDSKLCDKVLTEIAVEASPYQPRPGEVRRRVVLSVANPHPLEAWAQLQQATVALASGTRPDSLHPLVAETMRRIGGGAGLHTNGDRDMFCDLYRAVCSEAERQALEVPELP